MTPTQIAVLSDLLATAKASEPGIWIEAKDDRVMVAFRFDAAIGRELVCGFGSTLVEAHEAAVHKRADKIASAIVEAEVRAEVEARMQRAA